MNYKGIDFSIVQAANPFGWVWTVRFAEGYEKSGKSHSRPVAIARARAVIDDALSQGRRGAGA